MNGKKIIKRLSQNLKKALLPSTKMKLCKRIYEKKNKKSEGGPGKRGVTRSYSVPGPWPWAGIKQTAAATSAFLEHSGGRVS